MTGPTFAIRPLRDGLLNREIAFLVLMAGTSGAAIMAHTFGPVGMRYTAPFVVMPTAAVLLSLILLGRRQYLRLHLIADRLMAGALWGFLATFAYDAIRPPITWVFGLSFDPYKAMPIFGSLITGRPESDALAIAVGWTYHFWNGISFGMMFALVRPRGGIFSGLAWGLGLEALMIVTYPDFIGARLSDSGFLLTGIVGHAIWGLALGYGLSRRRDL